MIFNSILKVYLEQLIFALGEASFVKVVHICVQQRAARVCVCVCVCVCVYVCMYLRMHVCILVRVYACVYACMQVCKCVCMHTGM